MGASSGTGSGSVKFAVQANDGAAREGSIQVAGQTFAIHQEAASVVPGPPPPPPGDPCTFSLDPTAVSAGSTGGDVAVNVSVTSGTACAWTATSHAGFVTIKEGASGTGDGRVTLTVAPNSGTARTGSATIAGRTLTIAQDAAPPPPGQCAFTLSPKQSLVAPGGGTVGFTVTQTQGDTCSWTAVSQASFITVTSGASGTGNGTVAFTVAANTGSQRSGTINVAGQVFTVFQETACILSLSQFNYTVPASGGTVTVPVSFTGGTTCTWTVQSQSSFVTVSGANPTNIGAGSFTVTLPPNFGQGRTGTVHVTSTPYAYAVTFHQPTAGPPPGAVAVLRYQSSRGDYVGAGQSNSYTLTHSQYTAVIDSAQAELQFNMPFNGSTSWNVTLEAPAGQQLVPGLYVQTARWPFQPFQLPGLNFSGDGRGCNRSTGRFLVSQAVYGPNQTVQRFHAKFEQHCELASPVLRGELWIDAQGSTTPPPMADLPPGPATPTTIFSFTSDPTDTIGMGASGSYTIATAKFLGYDDGSRRRVRALVSELDGPLFRWNLAFDAGSGTLQPGTYTVTGGTGGPKFDISRFGAPTCTTATGSFQVFEILFGPQDELERFHVKFEYRCNGNPNAALRGEIYIVANPWK